MSNDIKAVIGLLFLTGIVSIGVSLAMLFGFAWSLLGFGIVCVGVALFGVWVSE